MSEEETTPPTAPPTAPRPIFDAFHGLQNRIAASFGITPEHRVTGVRAMLEREANEGPAYWLQIFVAMGIATLGLVLGSTAVVIGAMLISPLMGPLVGLGMGLATGSPFLVVRSLIRTVASIALVVGSAALITTLLPFHETTQEIASRTQPTVLDLSVAILCAVAAAYTTVKPGSDTTATAAGTAVGIALVPPLCVIGYGIGTGSSSIAMGAALLFTANLCAILLFAVLCFFALGYGTLSVAELEQAEIDKHGSGLVVRIARPLRALFASRYGRQFRVLMPLALVAAVYVPLRQALVEVTWQVRVRKAIEAMIASLPEDTVRSQLSIGRSAISLHLVMLGRAEQGAAIERDLRAKITAVSGLVPKVAVIAVPDSNALEEVQASLRASVTPVEVAAPKPDLDVMRADLGRALGHAWPTVAGAIVAWHLDVPRDGPATLEVVHQGAPLGPAAQQLVGETLAKELEVAILVREITLSREPIEAEPEAGLAWLPKALDALAALDRVPSLHACAEEPERPKYRPLQDAELVSTALRALPAARRGRLVIREGKRWQLRVTTEPCAPEGGVDAGPRDAGADASGR